MLIFICNQTDLNFDLSITCSILFKITVNCNNYFRYCYVNVKYKGRLQSKCFEANENKNRHSVRVSDCCLTPIQQFVSYIMTRTGFNNRQRVDDDIRFLLEQHA